jgi:hypothetical protein
MVRNLNKTGGRQALYRGTGALGFLAVARSLWLFGRDPHDRTRFVMATGTSTSTPAGLSGR